jgi:hypothetical protein
MFSIDTKTIIFGAWIALIPATYLFGYYRGSNDSSLQSKLAGLELSLAREKASSESAAKLISALVAENAKTQELLKTISDETICTLTEEQLKLLESIK